MADLGSAPVPGVSPADHSRGDRRSPVLIVYGDFECPFCAVLEAKLRPHRCHEVFRHFPVRSSHARAWPAACAAEAAGRQGRYWEMHDLLFADQGRLEDPHLWERARQLGLDLDRFESDRRSDAVLARVRADFQSGVRAGVVTTPTVFTGKTMLSGSIDDDALDTLLAGG